MCFIHFLLFKTQFWFWPFSTIFTTFSIKKIKFFLKCSGHTKYFKAILLSHHKEMYTMYTYNCHHYSCPFRIGLRIVCIRLGFTPLRSFFPDPLLFLLSTVLLNPFLNTKNNYKCGKNNVLCCKKILLSHFLVEFHNKIIYKMYQ